MGQLHVADEAHGRRSHQDEQGGQQFLRHGVMEKDAVDQHGQQQNPIEDADGKKEPGNFRVEVIHTGDGNQQRTHHGNEPGGVEGFQVVLVVEPVVQDGQQKEQVQGGANEPANLGNCDVPSLKVANAQQEKTDGNGWKKIDADGVQKVFLHFSGITQRAGSIGHHHHGEPSGGTKEDALANGKIHMEEMLEFQVDDGKTNQTHHRRQQGDGEMLKLGTAVGLGHGRCLRLSFESI